MTVSPELARIYASAPSDDDYIQTLELSHPLFTKTYYLAAEAYPVTAKLEDDTEIIFEPFPFTVKLPDQTGSGQQDLVISISNVDQAIIDELELANENPTQLINVTYRIYAASNLNVPAYIVSSLTMTDITADVEVVGGTATRTDVLNRPFPSQIYITSLYPGLDR